MRETMTRNWAELSEQEIAETWTRVGYDLPAGLLEETLARGSKMIPRLGPMIAEEAWWNEKEPPQWMAPCHALLLIAAIRSSEAAPYVAEWLRRGFGDDWLTEEGHKLVFWMGPDCIELIWGVAQDAGADVWGRLKALQGLCLLAIQHERVRERIIRDCRSLAGRLIEKPVAEFSNEDGMVLTRLCESLADLHDEDSKDLIRRGYRLGRCDEWTASEKNLLDEYDQPFGRWLQLDWLDPLEHFKPERLGYLKRLHLGIREKPRSPAPTLANKGDEPLRSTKVGRNDPCPCGSGRKYKKCCGAV